MNLTCRTIQLISGYISYRTSLFQDSIIGLPLQVKLAFPLIIFVIHRILDFKLVCFSAPVCIFCLPLLCFAQVNSDSYKRLVLFLYSNLMHFLTYILSPRFHFSLIAEPKYKYGQQEQVTVRSHNRSNAIELSVLKYWGDCCGSLLLLVLAVHIYTLVQLLC